MDSEIKRKLCWGQRRLTLSSKTRKYYCFGLSCNCGTVRDYSKSLTTRITKLEVCVPELVWNETRQDRTGNHFSNWRYRDKTNFFWSSCLGKFRKIRDGTGLLGITREKSWMVLKSPIWEFPFNFRDWDSTGKRIFLNAREGKFPRFFREKSGSREMAFRNADL